MTSSGVKTFDPTLSTLISMAYQEAGIISIMETPSDEQYIKGRNKLNLMLSEWMRAGHKVWTWEEGILFLQKSQRRYQLGSSSTHHFTDAYDFDNTTLSAAAASGATTITVAAAGTIAASDYLGIELDSGSFQFTTVSSIASTTVTPAAALTGAAASGNRVLAYTTKLIRPLKISSSRHFRYSTEDEIRVQELSHIDFMEQPNKTNTASPFSQWRYQPKVPLGIFEVWLTPSDVDYGVRFTYQRPIYDFTENAQTVDAPIEWGNAIVFGLAAELIPSGDVPRDRAEIIMAMATQKLALVSGADREQGSFLIQPDLEW